MDLDIHMLQYFAPLSANFMVYIYGVTAGLDGSSMALGFNFLVYGAPLTAAAGGNGSVVNPINSKEPELS